MEPVRVIKYFRAAMNAANRVVERGNYRPVSKPVLSASTWREYFREFRAGFFRAGETKKLGFRARVKRCRFTGLTGMGGKQE